MRMTELAAGLHLSPSGITRRIDGLVKSGFVERRQCPTDRRGSNAVLTDLGMKTLEEAAPTHLEGVRAHFIDRLSEQQLAELTDALASIDIDRTRPAADATAPIAAESDPGLPAPMRVTRRRAPAFRDACAIPRARRRRWPATPAR